MKNIIHKTAIIDKKTKLGKDITIGPYSIIGANVQIKNHVKIHSQVNIQGHTVINEGTEIFPFASIGTIPQDLKYHGEKTKLIIGKKNVIREHVTINPGTKGGGSITKIGNNCLLMVGSHVAHDCTLGNNVIMVNNATLAGHVKIEDFVIENTLGNGADLAIEAVGNPDLVAKCISIVKPKGQVLMIGVSPDRSHLPVNLYEMHYREIVLKGAFGRGEVFSETPNLLTQLNLDRMISGRYELNEVKKAIADSAEGKGIKLVVKP